MNRCIFTGRLTRDPELRYTSDGTAVCSASIAVDDGYKDKKKTYFPNIVMWRHNAEFIAQYAKKGDMIGVDCKMTEREWADRDGNKRTRTEFVADDVQILTQKKREDSTGSGYHNTNQGGGDDYKSYSNGGFNPIPENDEDGDLPF